MAKRRPFFAAVLHTLNEEERGDFARGLLEGARRLHAAEMGLMEAVGDILNDREELLDGHMAPLIALVNSIMSAGDDAIAQLVPRGDMN